MRASNVRSTLNSKAVHASAAIAPQPPCTSSKFHSLSDHVQIAMALNIPMHHSKSSTIDDKMKKETPSPSVSLVMERRRSSLQWRGLTTPQPSNKAAYIQQRLIGTSVSYLSVGCCRAAAALSISFELHNAAAFCTYFARSSVCLFLSMHANVSTCPINVVRCSARQQPSSRMPLAYISFGVARVLSFVHL